MTDISLNVPEIEEIFLSGPFDQLDLSTLSGLTSNTYLFFSDDFSGLNDFTGMESLTEIGDLEFDGDFGSLTGFSGLETIHGTLSINGTFDSLIGMDNLESVGNFGIALESNIDELSGFENLLNISDGLGISGPFEVVSSNFLTSLNDVGGSISISQTNLTDLIFLEDFDFLGSSLQALSIIENPNLDCNALDFCSIITSGSEIDLNISNNGPDCQEPECGSIFMIEFESQQEVDDFPSDFPNIVIIESSMIINGDDITDLSSLSQLNVINSLRIETSQLEDLSGLTGLTVLNELVVSESSTLIDASLDVVEVESVRLMAPLANLELSNMTYITENTTLTLDGDFEDFIGFEFITELRTLRLLSGIESLEGLNNLEHISRSLRLADLEMTQEKFDVLGNLTFVGNFVTVLDNTSLESLDFLENLSEQPNNVVVSRNPQLAYCNQNWICERINETSLPTTFENNLSSCNDNEDHFEVLCYTPGSPQITNLEIANCYNVPSIEITDALGNTDETIQVFDDLGNLVLVLNANGNELGIVDFEVYLSDVIREDGTPVVSRDFSIFYEQAPVSEIDLVLYYSFDELDELNDEFSSLAIIDNLETVVGSDPCTGEYQSGFTQGFGENFLYNSNMDAMKRISTTEEGTFFGLLASVIPVQLSSFSAIRKENRVELIWATASEINNDYFQIEHSTDGIRFSTLGFIEGQGTSTSLHNYKFEHLEPAVGLNYYRLKQIDFDGKVEYSDIVAIDFTADNLVKIFPNPVVDNLRIDNYTGPSVNIYNQMGQIVFRLDTFDNQIDLSHLSSGVYFLELGIERIRFIKL